MWANFSYQKELLKAIIVNKQLFLFVTWNHLTAGKKIPKLNKATMVDDPTDTSDQQLLYFLFDN